MSEPLAAWMIPRRRYFETVLRAFGPKRLMLRVLLLAGSHARWNEVVAGMISGLSASERQWRRGATAVEAYRLNGEK
jgi:hypothetical protein